jgi:hypothetical protein
MGRTTRGDEQLWTSVRAVLDHIRYCSSFRRYKQGNFNSSSPDFRRRTPSVWRFLYIVVPQTAGRLLCKRWRIFRQRTWTINRSEIHTKIAKYEVNISTCVTKVSRRLTAEGYNADLSLPSSAEVVNEQELYLFSPLRLYRCVVRLLWYVTKERVNLQ